MTLQIIDDTKQQKSNQRLSGLMRLISVKRKTGNRGFTLVEMIMVVIIVLVIYSFAVPTLSRYNVRKKLSFEAEKVAAVLELARSQATTLRVPTKVEFDAATHEFYYLDASLTGKENRRDKLYRLDPAVEFNVVPPEVVFKTTGALEAGADITVTLKGTGGNSRVDIGTNQRTGKVTVGTLY